MLNPANHPSNQRATNSGTELKQVEPRHGVHRQEGVPAILVPLLEKSGLLRARSIYYDYEARRGGTRLRLHFEPPPGDLT